MKKRLPLHIWLIPVALLAVLIWRFSREVENPAADHIGNKTLLENPSTTLEIDLKQDMWDRNIPAEVRAKIQPAFVPDPAKTQTIHSLFHQEAPAVVARPYPRGQNKERAHHAPVDLTLPESVRNRPPVLLAGLPEDGRVTLLPEETDTHTLQAVRMSFLPQALDDVLKGQTGRVQLPTPDGDMLLAEILNIRDRGGFTQTFRGVIAGYRRQASDVQLVYHDGILHGSVALYDIDRHFEYRILPDGHMMVRELDSSSMVHACTGAEENPEVHLAHLQEELADEGVALDFAGQPTAEEGVAGDEAVADTPGYNTVDVVVGYGIEARQAQGGVSQIEALIISSVDRMNTAFTNSMVTNAELMLLGTIEDPDYDFPGAVSGDMNTTDELGDLNSTSDGILDTVSDYASSLGADFKAFVVKAADGSAGVAYKPGNSSITARDYMTSNRLTFVHELGHNLGCDHSWGDSSQSYHYEYGWRLDPPSATRVRTVMAYDWSWGSGNRIPYFGNPDVEYLSARTGQVDGYNVSGDSESDSRYFQNGLNYSNSVFGFNGSNTTLGARNAHLIRDGSVSGDPDYDFYDGAASAAGRATRSSLLLSFPSAGITLEPGSSIDIVWKGGDYDDTVKIELFKGGSLSATIVASYDVGANGIYTWTIPVAQTAGTDYMIRVTRNGTATADSGQFSIGLDGPAVSAQTPDATVAQSGSVSSITMTFDEAMDPTTFSAGSDIQSFTGPQGSDLSGAITSTSWANGNTELTVTFSAQSGEGYYRMVLGPDIADVDGNLMDQNGDLTLGESPADSYAARFWISSVGGGTQTIWSDLVGTDTLDAGWSYSGGTWTSGNANENGSSGPDAGADGNPILGQNLSGNYSSGESSYAQSPVIDASSYTSVTLSFKGWKGAGKNDVLYVDAWDGGAWVRVYSYQGPNGGANDTSWVTYSPSISTQADGNASFQLRWGLDDATRGGSGTQTGWQVDQIMVEGTGGPEPPPEPVVVAHSPAGNHALPQSAWYIEFSNPMDTGSFALADIASFTGPSGGISATGFTWVSDTLLEIEFPVQSVTGTYTLVLNPTIEDTFGQSLDQDTDGTAGESTQDQYTASFTLAGNTAPTDISLSPSSIQENQVSGTVVGTLSTTDAEGGSFTYTLVSGTGDTDNGSFSVSGDQLLSAEQFDFESKDSYSIRVRTTDNQLSSYEKVLTVGITNVNEAPTITLDSPTFSTVSIPSDNGLILNTTVSDDNFGGSSLILTWSKVSGDGTLTWDNTNQADTGVQFSIDGEYILRLTADDGTLTTSMDFTVFVGNGTPTTGLFAHFPMDDTAGSSTAAETSGNNYTGTVSGDVDFGTLGGRPNVATFGGGGGDIESPSAGQALSGLTAFSASFWYYANASMLDTDGGLIETLEPAGASNNTAGDFVVRFDDQGWFSTPSNSSQNHFNISLNTTDGNIIYYTAENTMDSGQWHHFVFVWESGSLPKVYLDGVEDTPTLVGTLSSVFTLNQVSNGAVVLPTSLFFGRQLRDETNESWHGGMDDVRFYNRALTAAEVTLLHQGQPANEGPDVDAGSLANGATSQNQSLDGTVTDDGNPSASITALWTQRSGSGTVTFGDTGVIDTTVSADAADTYVLRLQADDGEIITFDDLSWTVSAPSAPDAPSGLLATAASSTTIDLSWTDNSGNESGFKIERATSSGGPWTSVNTTAANVTSYQDTGRTAGTEYFYQIIATNATGDSGASNEASATTWTTEQQYFADSGLAYNVDPDIDSDGDGQSNQQEFWAGTDPDDANSLLEIVNLTVSAAGVVTLEWSSDQTGNTAARQYRIMYTDGPLSDSSTWFELQGTIDASGSGTNTLQDDLSGEGPGQRTYRIEIEGSPQAQSVNVRTARIYTLAENKAHFISFPVSPAASTLDGLLGSGLPAGSSEATSTVVDVWNQVTQTMSTRYWYSDIPGWIRSSDSGNGGSDTLDLSKGIKLILRDGVGTQKLYVAGTINTSSSNLQQTVQDDGLTLAAPPVVENISFNAQGGGDGTGLVASGFVGNSNSPNSDRVYLQNPITGDYDVLVWYYTGDSTWRDADGNLANVNLEPGKPVLIRRKNRGGDFTWSLTPSYTP